jgi:Ser/Thr protein kinase RdoA (MazF antagonist)
VSKPIPQQNGDFIQTVPAPEGDRHIVLFDYAKGKPVTHDKSESEALNYGKAAAAIHNAAQDFSSKYTRFTLDLEHFIDTPTEIIQPLFSQRNDDWEYLQQLIKKVRHELDELPIGGLEQGFCHGDFHGGNAHSDDDGQVTFFDFDCGGWGWRAYDIAVFQWGNRKKTFWEPFLRGYTEERSLNALDLRAVPLFVFLRQYWFIGLHVGNAHDWGYSRMDELFEWSIKEFRELEKDYFSDPE